MVVHFARGSVEALLNEVVPKVGVLLRFTHSRQGAGEIEQVTIEVIGHTTTEFLIGSSTWCLADGFLCRRRGSREVRAGQLDRHEAGVPVRAPQHTHVMFYGSLALQSARVWLKMHHQVEIPRFWYSLYLACVYTTLVPGKGYWVMEVRSPYLDSYDPSLTQLISSHVDRQVRLVVGADPVNLKGLKVRLYDMDSMADLSLAHAWGRKEVTLVRSKLS